MNTRHFGKANISQPFGTEYRGRVYGHLLTFFWKIIYLALVWIVLLHFKKKFEIFLMFLSAKFFFLGSNRLVWRPKSNPLIFFCAKQNGWVHVKIYLRRSLRVGLRDDLWVGLRSWSAKLFPKDKFEKIDITSWNYYRIRVLDIYFELRVGVG